MVTEAEDVISALLCALDVTRPLQSLPRETAAPLLESEDVTASFERDFLRRLFDRMLDEPSDALRAAVHAYCLFQNLILRRLVMASHDGNGLDRFVDRYSGHPIRDLLDREKPERLVQAFRAGRVFWLEARVKPNNIADRVAALQSAIQHRTRATELTIEREPLDVSDRLEIRAPQPNPAASLPAVGLLLHYVKQPDSPRGGVSHAHGMLRLPARDQAARHEAWRAAEAIASLIRVDDAAAQLILGLDVCGSEMRTPIGTYAAQVRYVRQQASRIGDFPRHRYGSDAAFWESSGLGATCHAGEDFIHLLTGLRHVDEAMEFYELKEGDRLGHAIALGLEPSRWSRWLGRQCVLRQGELLDDLVWFQEWLARIGQFGSVRQQVLDLAQRLARRIYEEYRRVPRPERLHAQVLWDAWTLRSEDPPATPNRTDSLESGLGLSAGRRFAHQSRAERLRQLPDNVFETWRDYHTDRVVRERWDLTIEVDVDAQWIPALEAVQAALLDKVVEKRLVIEVNPSSNLTLGPFECLEQHPIFRWLDPRKDLASQRAPWIAIGSDDPSAFGCELLHEYAFLGRAAENLGASQRQIQAWLEHLRQTGIRFSFFPRASFSQVGSS